MMKPLLQPGILTRQDFLFRPMKRLILLSLIMFLPLGLFSQSKPKIIQGWNNLEEADFLFDVYYQIVECTPLISATEVHLWAFNEGGNVDAIGFTLTLKDGDGTKVTHTIKKFEIGLGKSHKADCANDDYPYLKFALPTEIDLATLTIDITYNK